MSLIWPEIETDAYMNTKVILKRISADNKQTLGELVYNGVVVARTLELPWLNNRKKVSCIPTGVYTAVERRSAKYGHHWHLTNVPGRDMILIHHGNYHTDIQGCILVGKRHADINKDGYADVTESKVTMSMLRTLLPPKFTLTIE